MTDHRSSGRSGGCLGRAGRVGDYRLGSLGRPAAAADRPHLLPTAHQLGYDSCADAASGAENNMNGLVWQAHRSASRFCGPGGPFLAHSTSG